MDEQLKMMDSQMQAGWSPTYTLTEDYALGMELKKEKLHCRYVQVESLGL